MFLLAPMLTPIFGVVLGNVLAFAISTLASSIISKAFTPNNTDNKAVNDVGYIEEATKARMEIQLITGEQAEHIVAVSSNASPAVLDKLRNLQSEK
jgi:hypothetical protein